MKQKTRQADKNCISFFDLLGTKATARNDTADYEKLIEVFREAINVSTSHFSEDDKIWIYSDNAYIETRLINTMVEFYEKLRMELFLKGIFFTAAIDLGKIDANDVDKAYQKGTYFVGVDTTKIYAKQAHLGGIGIECGPSIVQKIQESVCSSYYFKTPECKELQKFSDIKYSTADLVFLEYILTKFIKTRLDNYRASRYYLSAIISVLRSLDYTSLTIEKLKEISTLCSFSWLIDNSDQLFNVEKNVFILILLQELIRKSDDVSKLNPKMEAVMEIFRKRPFDILSIFQNGLAFQTIEPSLHDCLMDYLLKKSRKDFILRQK